MKRLLPLLALCTALLTAISSCKKPTPEPTPGPDDKGKVTSISFLAETSTMTVGERPAMIGLKVLPEGATPPADLVLSSDNPAVVMVTDDGIVPVGPGTATLTISSASTGLSATCTVTVVAKDVPVEKIEINNIDWAVGVEIPMGSEETLSVTVSPSDATNRNLVWTSDNPEVVTVEDGKLVAVGTGTATVTVSTEDGSQSAAVRVTVYPAPITYEKMDYEFLPDMSIPRSDMAVFYCGNELVVAGGHSDGFSPTSTGEYLKDGVWTSMNMTAKHDNQACAILENGKVAVLGGTGGGGSGRHSNVDLYDPETHSFSAMPQMSTSRGLFHAAAIGNDIIVSGNWYSGDNIERYNAADNTFSVVKEVSFARSNPYVIRSAKNNALVFGTYSIYGGMSTEPCVVDRLDGDAFTPKLFNDWRPMYVGTSFKDTDCLIGNPTTDDYRYLIALESAQTDGKYGIGLINGEEFTLVQTNVEIPARDRDGNTIYYSGTIQADRSKQVAYMFANNRVQNNMVCYILKIDYSQVMSSGVASLSMYQADPISSSFPAGQSGYAMMPDGRLLVVGGIFNSNYSTFTTVCAFKPF